MTNAWNTILGWPIYSDVSVSYSPTLSGGSWEAALPLTNLQDSRLARVARSTAATLAATLLKADLGVARAVRLVAIPKHTLTTAALWRVRGMTVLPLAEWGTVGDGSWTAVGTPTRTGAALVSTGIPLDLLGDDDAGSSEYTYRATPAFTSSADKVFSLVVKRNATDTHTTVELRDSTTMDTRGIYTITWTGTVPTAAGATGSLVSTVARGDGSYRITWKATGVVHTNNHILIVTPCDGGPTTGDLYIGNIEIWDAATVGTVEDSEFVAAWPAGVTLEQSDGLNVPALYLCSADVTARYWRVEVADTANPAGYIDLARLCICAGWQPTINFEYGAKLGLTDSTTHTETDGGAVIHGVRPTRRTAMAQFSNLPEDEALASAFDFQRLAGTSGQLFFVYDPTDTTHIWRRSFLATLKELSALEAVPVSRYSVPFALVEEL